MADTKLKKYYDVLEISPDASELEIRNAYMRLKKLYSTDSVVISPIADEFSVKERREILLHIEEAFNKLMEYLKSKYSDRNRHVRQRPLVGDLAGEGDEDVSYSGSKLKKIREKLGIPLFEVSLDTKIRMELLKSIEQEKFDVLPPEVYLRGHLINYANYLKLNAKKVAGDYMARYESWKEGSKEEN
jgi:curved DNA-binding protein CbpA